MAEGLARKKRIRAGHKASTTKLLTKLNELRTAPDPVDTSKLLRLKLSLEEKLDTLKTLDGEILDLTKENDLGNEIEQADSYKEEIYDAMIAIEKLCAAVCAAETPPAPLRITASPTATPLTDSSRVNVPKLSLKPFDGDFTTWTTFWDSYESAIHKIPTLSEIDNFNCLKSLLDRTAQRGLCWLNPHLCQLWGCIHSLETIR